MTAVVWSHPAWQLAVFGALCFALAAAGGLAGLVLGNLRLPLAVSMASTVAAAGGANVAISGVAALTAVAAHIRAGRINWRLFGWLAPASLAGGYLGGVLAGEVSGGVLLAAIAAVLYYGAWELFHWRPREEPAAVADLPPTERLGEPAPAAPDAPPPAAAIGLVTTRDRAVVTAIGLVVGVLGGAVGLILGSLRLPALLRFTGEQPKLLVGTNLAAGVMVGVAGAIGHLANGHAAFDGSLFVVGAATSAPGAWIGARLTGRLTTVTLVRAIAGVVLLAAIGMTVDALN